MPSLLRSPTFLAPVTDFVEDNFSADPGGAGGRGDGFRVIQACYPYCGLYFYYYYISSTSEHQALDPGSWRPQVMLHWVGCVTPNPSPNLLCCILCPGRLMCLDYINRHLCPLVLSWVGSIRNMNVRSWKAGGWSPALMVSAPLGGTIPPQTVITLFFFFSS